MLAETFEEYEITGRIERSGYVLTITAPGGATARAVYPGLGCDRDARLFARRLITQIVTGRVTLSSAQEVPDGSISQS
jgi:hypothetical protein